MESLNKEQTEEPSTMSQPLGLLDVLQDDDSLRSALLRTPASDHAKLRQTCSRIREIMDSPVFAQERSEHGFAEVSVSLVLPQDDVDLAGDDFDSEQYNDLGSIGEYGETSSEATIFVDGNKAGTISMKLLPLDSQENFHEVGDSISDELQEIATLFFTPRGNPTRVRSIKQAYQELYQEFLAQEPRRDNVFLYITTFELKAPYRTTSSNIGALALRHLLKTVLNLRWTLAMYIPYGRTHMTKEEMDLKYDVRLSPQQPPTDEYMNIFQTKTIQDMRQFLRAGFAQVKETVLNTDCYHVFCVPSFLEEEILSHDQELAIPIKTRPKPPPKLSENAQALLAFMVSSCSSRHGHSQTIMSWRVPALEHPLMRSAALSITTMQEQVQESRQVFESILPSVRATQPALREQLDSAAAMVEESHQTLKQGFQNIAHLQIEEVKQKLEELDTNVCSKVTQRVEEFGYGIILQSNSIHACASNLEGSYIEMLMGFLPSDQKTQAINGFDQKNGVTPLMLAAAKIVDNTRDTQLQTCRLLLNLGANNDIVDASGMTALGRFRDSQRSSNDFINSMMPSRAGREQDAKEQHNQQMEALLMPSSGPTEADDTILEDDPPDSEDDGVWDDFDDDADDADY
eukprot:scaffold24250_cov61-Attheya_sp.AAC.1